jgi:hypothetical protein
VLVPQGTSTVQVVSRKGSGTFGPAQHLLTGIGFMERIHISARGVSAQLWTSPVMAAVRWFR